MAQDPKKIPKATITRLSMYYRQLELLEFDGYRMVSSDKLAWLCRVTPAQVRKDLGYFGEFGTRGQGYDVIELQKQIKSILALNRPWNFVVVGVGNLGSAIILNDNLRKRGFLCVAAFDIDENKINRMIGDNVYVMELARLAYVIKQRSVDMGVITTPPSAAQEVAELLVDNGVHAIINFTPARIVVPECCIVDNVDLTVNIDIIAYKLYHNILK